MIRNKRLVLVLTPLLLIWAGTHFFLDQGIQRALEKTGTTVNGARVDIGKVRTSFFPPRFSLYRLQITDSNAPLTNALEIGIARFSLEGKPLFWKKIVINQADITGIRTQTPRRTSGALPADKAPASIPEPVVPTA